MSASVRAATIKEQNCLQATKLDPFKSTEEVISNHIVGIHDSQATKYDVSSVYSVLENMIKSSTHTGERLRLKRPRASVELVQDTVPCFMPSLRTLKEIACKITCNTFDSVTAHETIVWILEKLRSHTWDVKALIVLAAFALDYGEPWRLSLVEATKEAGLLEFHVLRLAGEDKPNNAILSDFSTLVEPALKLIKRIAELEKQIKANTPKPVTVSCTVQVQRETCTYWAIFALLACSCRSAESDLNFKSEVARRLSVVLNQLNAYLKALGEQQGEIEDYNWRLSVFRNPSGFLELLKALLYPKDIKFFEVFDCAAKILVNAQVLKTMNVLLFISGLDKIDDDILILKKIHEGFTGDRQNYKILWIPIVDKWTDEVKVKFGELKKKMPWYTVECFLSPIKGMKLLQQEWHYRGKPILVVTNPRGEVINKNAMHMIFTWSIQAYPFRPELEATLSQHWNWFWNAAKQVHANIATWTTDDKFIFFIGGSDTQNIVTKVEEIKQDEIIKKADVSIELFCLTKDNKCPADKFWQSITNSFLCKVQQDKYNFDPIFDVLTLLSMKNEKGWALLSRGENILLLCPDPPLTKVVEEFGSWKTTVESKGFDDAFIEYYKSKGKGDQCSHLQLNDIRSEIPRVIRCPDPSCCRNLEIESINYKCCHGKQKA